MSGGGCTSGVRKRCTSAVRESCALLIATTTSGVLFCHTSLIIYGGHSSGGGCTSVVRGSRTPLIFILLVMFGLRAHAADIWLVRGGVSFPLRDTNNEIL